MKIDLHIHSSFSGDCDTQPEEMVIKGIQSSLDIMCFTEHLDMDYPYSDVNFNLDVDSYIQCIQNMQKHYAGQMDIRLGIELGLQPRLADYYSDYVKKYDFDFVIGSTHLVHQVDPYYVSFWEGRNPNSACLEFFEATLKNIETNDCFDVYGHLDYVIRYVPDNNWSFSYKYYSEILDEILKSLIEKGKGIEINTGGFKSGLGMPNPCPDIIRRYRELGGEIITVGSDAHFVSYVGYQLDKAAAILKDCGFRYQTVFKCRKPEFIAL